MHSDQAKAKVLLYLYELHQKELTKSEIGSTLISEKYPSTDLNNIKLETVIDKTKEEFDYFDNRDFNDDDFYNKNFESTESNPIELGSEDHLTNEINTYIENNMKTSGNDIYAPVNKANMSTTPRTKFFKNNNTKTLVPVVSSFSSETNNNVYTSKPKETK